MSPPRFIRISAIAAEGLAPSRSNLPHHSLSVGSFAFDHLHAGSGGARPRTSKPGPAPFADFCRPLTTKPERSKCSTSRLAFAQNSRRLIMNYPGALDLR